MEMNDCRPVSPNSFMPENLEKLIKMTVPFYIIQIVSYTNMQTQLSLNFESSTRLEKIQHLVINIFIYEKKNLNILKGKKM